MTEVQEEIEAAAEDILSVADYLKDALDAGDEIYESKWLDPLMRVHGLLLASGLPAAIEARDKALERVKALEEIVALEVSMTKAAQDVCLERSHQQTREGWTYEHDDEHFLGEMAAAAACYALYGNASTHQHNVGPNLTKDIWPWSAEWWKPKDDKRKNLVRAGALIIAEIERLDRAALRSHP